MSDRFEMDPWQVPVPVRASTFVSLHVEHEPCNRVVHLAAIRPFRFGRHHPAAELAHADYQTNADINLAGRLGSGRAAFLAGKYLKGVGRTSLAGNWADASDGYHNSGALSTSAAIREYLSTCYLRARGLAHTIVPCEGLLVRARSRRERTSADAPGSSDRVAPIDRLFHAITVKPGHFARMSNFLWSADRVGQEPGALFHLLHRVVTYCVPPGTSPPAADECSPASIASLLQDAARRGLGHFGDYMRAGVFWGSFHNNFTADGRFLDLETPVITGGPLLAAITRGPPPMLVAGGPQPTLIGLEAIAYISQVREGLTRFSERIAALGRRSPPGSMVADFCDELVTRLAAVAHELIEERTQRKVLAAQLARLLGLSSRRRQRLRAFIEQLPGTDRGAVPVERLAIELADVEPGVMTACFYPSFAPPGPQAVELARVVNRSIVEVEAATTVDQLFSAVRAADALIARACARTPL